MLIEFFGVLACIAVFGRTIQNLVDIALYAVGQAGTDDVVVAGIGNGVDHSVEQHPQPHDDEHHQGRRAHSEDRNDQAECGKYAENQNDGQANRQNIDEDGANGEPNGLRCLGVLPNGEQR